MLLCKLQFYKQDCNQSKLENNSIALNLVFKSYKISRILLLEKMQKLITQK